MRNAPVETLPLPPAPSARTDESVPLLLVAGRPFDAGYSSISAGVLKGLAPAVPTCKTKLQLDAIALVRY